jgi:hypothetical protein
MRRIRGRTLLLATVAAVAVTAGAGYAAIPSSSGAVNGCYERITGILRVIDKDAGKSCKSFETAIAWSVQGPTGPAGAIGAQGEPGVRGEKGEPGTPAPNYSAGLGLELVGTEFRLGFDPATQTELDAATAAITSLQHQVSDLSNRNSLQASQIAGLQSDVQSLETGLATARTQLQQLTSAISVTAATVTVNRPLRVQGTVTAQGILLVP